MTSPLDSIDPDTNDENRILSDYVMLESEALSSRMEDKQIIHQENLLVDIKSMIELQHPFEDPQTDMSDHFHERLPQDEDKFDVTRTRSDLGINHHFTLLEMEKYEALGMKEQAMKCPLSNEACSVLSRFFLRLVICIFPYVFPILSFFSRSYIHIHNTH